MFNMSENIRNAFTALFASKLRSILATIGIGIGIAAVVGLVVYGIMSAVFGLTQNLRVQMR